MKIEVDPRVFELHPELSEDDVKHAVGRPIKSQHRLDTDPMECVGVGPDLAGNTLQWIGVRHPDDVTGWYIYHSMRATKKVLKELGMI